jgi:arginase
MLSERSIRVYHTNMKIQIILVPYDSGHKDVRMGRGPGAFIQSGLVDLLRNDGHEVELEWIKLDGSFLAEIACAFELNRILSQRVRHSISAQKFPLILSGNCMCSVGAIAGHDGNETGLIWFDGHGDFNTPETTISGFLDGMTLAVATGRCWRTLSSTISEFHPVKEHNVILVGARDFDVEEKRLLDCSGVALVSRPFIRSINIVEALKPAVDDLQNRVKNVHVHIDLDVLDPAKTPANHLAPPDGLSVGAAELAIRLVEGRFTISSACIAAYDPDCDPKRVTIEAGTKLIQTILRRTR